MRRIIDCLLCLVAFFAGDPVAVFARLNQSAAREQAPIAIAQLERAAPVEFEKEILPILKANCLACHNATKAKADLILETPADLLKGGESGPAIVRHKSDESLLLKVASRQEEPFMPPKDNKVEARALTSEELGLIRLWIDQGAKGEVRAAGPIQWQPLPPGLNPIYAVALTKDGQYAACGRANQIFVYQLSSGQLVTRLTDPELLTSGLYKKRGAAHRDLVQSLAFSPDGTRLASGAYREVKLWRRPKNQIKLKIQSPAELLLLAVDVSSDGKWLAAGGEDRRINIWDLATGKLVRTLNGHENSVTAIKFSPDSLHLVSGSSDRTIRIWQVLEGKQLALANTDTNIQTVVWLASGKQLASGAADHLIRIWDWPDSAQNELKHSKDCKGHEGTVSSLAVIPSEPNQILSGSADGSVRQWNIQSGELIRKMDHGGPVSAVAVRNDGKRFASAGLNQVAKLWDAQNGTQLAELKGDRNARDFLDEAERLLAFAKSEVDYWKQSLHSTETNHLAQLDLVKKATEASAAAEKTLGDKGTALTNAVASKTVAEKTLAEISSEIDKVTKSFESADKAAKDAVAAAKLALENAAKAEGSAELAERTKLEIERIAEETGRIAAKTEGSAAISTESNAKTPSDKTAAEVAAVALKTKALAESIGADAAKKMKAAAEARSQAQKAMDELLAKAYAAGHSKAIYERVSAEAKEKQKQTSEKLNAANKQLEEAQKQFKAAEIAAKRSEEDLKLAISSAQKAAESLAETQKAFQLAEAEQKEAANQFDEAKQAHAASEKPLRAIAFSPDNRTLAAAGDHQTVHSWSAETGAPFDTYQGHRRAVVGLDFTPDGALVSADAEQFAIVWDLNADWTLEQVIGTGDIDSSLAHRVNALAFSPDGQRLVTGSGEPSRSSEIKLWDVTTGQLAQEFKNVHSDAVLGLDFSPDGKYLASSSADRFMKVVEVTTGRLVKSFEGHTHHVLGVSWRRNGRVLASCGADQVIKIWDFVTGERKRTIEGFGKEVTSIDFIGITDQCLASSGDKKVRLVDENGKDIRSFTGAEDFLYSAAATPSGHIVVAGGQDGALLVWNGTNGQQLATFQAPPIPETSTPAQASKL